MGTLQAVLKINGTFIFIAGPVRFASAKELSTSKKVFFTAYFFIKTSCNHLQGSITTLHFASRLNSLKVGCAVNKNSDPHTRIKELENELESIKKELRMKYILSRKDDKEPPCASYEPLTAKDVGELQNQVKDFLDGKSTKLDMLSIRHMEKTFDLIKQEYRNQSVEICRLIKEQYDSADKTELPKDEIQTTGSGNVKQEKKEDKKAKKEEVKKTPVKKNEKSIDDTKTSMRSLKDNLKLDEIHFYFYKLYH